MPRHRRWSDLVPGLLALVAAVGIGAAVLLFGRVGALHGRTMHLFATVAGARGLSAGSEVWLGGQRIGLVHAIRFRPPDADTANPLLLEMQVLESAAAMIHRDATVTVHPGGNLIGAPIVDVSFSRPTASPVREGDTLRTKPGEDLEQARAEFATASAELPAVMANVKLLAAQLRAAQGTLGAFGIDGLPIDRLGAAVGRVRSTLTNGDGTIGLAMHGDALSARTSQAMAAADSVRALLTTPGETSLGRFRRDSTLFVTIGAVRTELADVMRQLNSTQGTVGRARADSALAHDLADTHDALSALIADLKRHPLRYITISSF